MKYLTIVIIILMVTAGCSDNRANDSTVSEGKPSHPSYSCARIENGGVPIKVKLPGQLAAFKEVSIFPKVNGYVKTVLVDIGSKVSAGDVLMVLEAPELLQSAIQAKEKYARAKADLTLDRERYSRLLEAAQTQGAISPLDLSAVKAKVDADSAICNAEFANWQMQQTMQGYLRVIAPFSGVVTERNVHPGALVSASVKDRPMLELKELTHLRLQVDVPENMASSLHEKDTVSFFVSSRPGQAMYGTISRKSGNVNSQFRSERIEIDIPNSSGDLSSGMYADVELSSKGNTSALFVPKSAVVNSTERKYLLIVQNGKIRKVDVITGNTSNKMAEVFGELVAGDSVITNASDEILESVK